MKQKLEKQLEAKLNQWQSEIEKAEAEWKTAHEAFEAKEEQINNERSKILAERDMHQKQMATAAAQLEEYLKSQRHLIEVTPIALPKRNRHVAASREIAGGEKMIEAFNRALAEAKKDGSHAAIVRKWDERYNIPK